MKTSTWLTFGLISWSSNVLSALVSVVVLKLTARVCNWVPSPWEVFKHASDSDTTGAPGQTVAMIVVRGLTSSACTSPRPIPRPCLVMSVQSHKLLWWRVWNCTFIGSQDDIDSIAVTGCHFESHWWSITTVIWKLPTLGDKKFGRMLLRGQKIGGQQ